MAYKAGRPVKEIYTSQVHLRIFGRTAVLTLSFEV